MATGDALDQALSELDAENQQRQQRQQRRIPAPRPATLPPVGSTAAGGPGRPASTLPPQSRGGPSILQRIGSAASGALDTMIPGSGSLLSAIVQHPQTVLGAGAGILRSPVTAAANIADTGADVAHAAGGPRADPRSYQANISPAGIAFRYAPTQDTYASFGRNIDPLSHIGAEPANEMASNVASVAVGYGAGSSLLRFAGVLPKLEAGVQAIGNPVLRSIAGIAGRAVGAGMADAVTMDPESERFSNILQQVGVHNEFIDWLAHSDDEGRLAGRFKNAIEGTGLTAAGDSLFQAGRYWRARYLGDNTTADAIQADLAAHHDGQVPDYITHETPGAPPPSTDPPGYVSGWEQGEDGALRPTYSEDPLKDATPEVKAQAADEGITPEGEKPTSPLPEGSGSTGGSVPPLDPKAIAKATGDGAAAGDGIVTYSAQRTPDEAPQVVGSADRASLTALSQDVERWKDAAAGGESLDILHPSDTASQVGEFKLGRFNSPSEVEPLLRAISDRIPAGRTLSDEELARATQASAAALGEDPATILSAAQNIGGTLDNAAEHMALLTLWARRAAVDIDALGKPNWETADQAAVDEAGKRVYNLNAIWTQFQKAKSGLGRGLRVNQLPDADSYLNTLRKAAAAGEPTVSPDAGSPAPLPRTRQEMQTWFDAWQATKGDPKLRSDFLEAALTRSVPSPGQYLRNSFPNLFTAAILSAVKTHLLGFTGPTLMSIMRNTERLSGGFMASLNPLITSEQRNASLIAARQASFNYVGLLNDTTEAVHWAAKAAGENSSQLHSGITFDSSRTAGPINPALIEAAGYNPSDIRYPLGNIINILPRAIARVYNFTDDLTQRLAYMRDVRARAVVEGASNGLEGSDLQEFIRDKLKFSANRDPTIEATASDGTQVTYPNRDYGSATNPDALASAARNSFLGQVGTEGTWVRKMADGINAMRKDVPELRYLLPVFNVPANILGEIIKRTPFAIAPGFGAEQTFKALRGDFGPLEQAEAHGRMLTGAAFLTTGLLLTRHDMLTGAGPQEGTARKVWLEEHQPWSLRVGDQWVRMDRYDVAGGLLTIPATIADSTVHVKQDEKVGDLVMAGVGALAEWFKDRASLRTAAALLELGDDPMTNTGDQVKRMTGQTAAGFIPNILQSMVTQQIDPVLRRKQAWFDYLKAAIPGLSTTLPPVRNTLGEPVNRAADTMGEAIFPVTIAPAISWKQDPVIDEMDRLYHSTGYAAGADPQSIGYGYFHPQDVTLENGQTLYDAFMEARQHMTIEGRTLRQSLGQLFNSPEYTAAVDADPGQKETSRGDASRGYMVKQTFEAYNKQIKAELAESSPIANKWLTAAAAKQRDDAYLQGVSAEDLVNNPNYYQSHGIDPVAYSSKVREGATGALATALKRR